MKIYHGRPIFTLLQTKQVKTIGLIAGLRHIAPTCTLLNNYQSLINIAPYLTYGLISWANACKTFRDQILEWMNEWINEWMNEESWMRGQQTHPLTIHFTMWTVSSDVSMQRRSCQPPSVHLWTYYTHPTHDVNDVMCEGWPQHRGLRPLLFSNCGVDSFRSPQEPDKC